jgi:L-ribulose-5-phosphate 3-epimerase
MENKGERPVKNPLTRREFLAGATAAGLGVSAAISAEGEKPDEGFKTKLHKAIILGGVNAKDCDACKAAGFEGFECGAWSVKPADAEAGRKIAEKAGLRIHSVLRGWTSFNNAKGVDGDIASVETSLRAAAGYGADAVLLVPCRTGVGGPQAGEFEYEFDPKTCHVTAVVKGNNAKWADYIKAQNEATDTSKAAVEKLIPAAEKAGVVIALENVWNNLWSKPDLFAAFVRMFDSKWVQAYFDIGNHVKYAAPELWIAALGKLLAKCHVKDFKLSSDGHGGSFTAIREGSVNWPAVRKELDKVGYNGWMTIEDGRVSLKEQNDRLDLIIAGK